MQRVSLTILTIALVGVWMCAADEPAAPAAAAPTPPTAAPAGVTVTETKHDTVIQKIHVKAADKAKEKGKDAKEAGQEAKEAGQAAKEAGKLAKILHTLSGGLIKV